jgi:hypothetical protein
MAQGHGENAHTEIRLQPPRRQWHAPHFDVLELGSTALTPHGPLPDNPGQDMHHS